MKILVTGHEGFIGQNIVEKFINQHELLGYEWTEDGLPDVAGFDWVIHLGAISSTTETDVDKILLQNYEFSKWLYNECNSQGVNLQYASSASVYGDTTHFTEDRPVGPKNPYAWSKYLFDRWISKQKPKIIVQGFRYFNVYGKYEDHKGSQASVFHKFQEQAKNEKCIKLFENSENYLRDFICVNDVVELHKLFLTLNKSGIWNIGTGNAVSFDEIAKLFSNKLNVPIEHISMPQSLEQHYQKYTCANLDKLRSDIGDFQFISPKDYVGFI